MVSKQPSEGVPWETGFWKRLPWRALLGLFAFVVSCVMMAVVLILSDNKEADLWPTASYPVSPAPLLSLLGGFANTCLAFSIGEALTIAWWIKALKGTTVKQLQYDIQVPLNLLLIPQKWRLFNTVSLASIVALAVGLLDGPVIQKASTSTGKTLGPNGVSVEIPQFNSTLPPTFSDWSGSGTINTLLMPIFSNVYQDYSNQVPIAFPYTGCANGTCKMTVPGPGLDMNCVDSTLAYDFNTLSANHNTINVQGINITWNPSQTVESMQAINVSVIYKSDASCQGKLSRRQCVMRSAKVNYDISITNATAFLSPWDPNKNNTISINNFHDWTELGAGSVGAGGFFTMLGGFATVAQSLYQSNTTLRQAVTTNIPFLVAASGQAASKYLTSPFSSYGNCTMTWSDPWPDIANTMQSLMFRSAIAQWASNTTEQERQSVSAQETRTTIIYQSHYQFFGIAVACMFVQVFFIVLLLVGYQRLGREVSLDPFEVAKAMGAPLLEGGASNASADEVCESFGDKAVRYGELPSEYAMVELIKPPIRTQEVKGVQREQIDQTCDIETPPGEQNIESREDDLMLVNGSDGSRHKADGIPVRPILVLAELERVQEIRSGVPY